MRLKVVLPVIILLGLACVCGVPWTAAILMSQANMEYLDIPNPFADDLRYALPLGTIGFFGLLFFFGLSQLKKWARSD